MPGSPLPDGSFTWDLHGLISCLDAHGFPPGPASPSASVETKECAPSLKSPPQAHQDIKSIPEGKRETAEIQRGQGPPGGLLAIRERQGLTHTFFTSSSALLGWTHSSHPLLCPQLRAH